MGKSKQESLNTEDRILYFPKGLIGFSQYKHFSLIQLRPKSSMLLMQHTQNKEISLLVLNPFDFITDYEIKITDKEQKIINVQSVEQLSILVTASIPQDRPDIIYLHLNSPIFINFAEKVAIQVIQAENKFPQKLKLQLVESADKQIEMTNE